MEETIIRTISCSYSKACSFNNIAELMHQTIDLAQGNLSLYLSNLIQEFCNRLGIMTTIIPSSRIFEKEGLKGQERIINICTRLGATSYVNLPGGKELYEHANFQFNGIQLHFLKSPNTIRMKSGLSSDEHLSILDTLMYNKLDVLSSMSQAFNSKIEDHGN